MIDLHSVDLWQQAAVVINAVIAAVLGSLIGWERDRAGKAAGARTMALVCASSAVIVAIGAVMDVEAQYGDPTRALHAVITGIGGVTTAATVFTTAAVGVAVGLGFQVAGAGLTLVILIILRSTQVIEATTNRHD